MADIRKMNIFGSQNKGLDQIKKASTDKKMGVLSTPNKGKETEIQRGKVRPSTPTKRKKSKKGAGTPIRNHDRVYTTSQPIKLSALLNTTSRILSETHLANYSRDEILREALDNYIRVNFLKEDKKALLMEVNRELQEYRKKNPTVARVDEDGNVIETAEMIENSTLEKIKEKWEI